MWKRKQRYTGDTFQSKIYESGIYQWKGEYAVDEQTVDGTPYAHYPVLVDILNGDRFFMKCVTCGAEDTKRYLAHIAQPVHGAFILWPRDLVSIPAEQSELCQEFLSQTYTAEHLTASDTEEKCGLLFPCDIYPPAIPGVDRLNQIPVRNWTNPVIKHIALEMVRCIDVLNRWGYAYMDFHFTRFLFTQTHHLRLNYSNLIFSLADLAEKNPTCQLKPGTYPIELADPAMVANPNQFADLEGQNYSLCAMLFYLFFGRYPYEGRLLAGYVDDNLQNHYIKFRDYHKMPVFIFDPDDTQNALGAFEEEQRVMQLWESCPVPIRQLFIQTLRQKNALRQVPVCNPTAETWLDCFTQLGWVEKEMTMYPGLYL